MDLSFLKCMPCILFSVQPFFKGAQMERKNNESWWYAWSTIRHGECLSAIHGFGSTHKLKIAVVVWTILYLLYSFARCQGFVVITMFSRNLFHKYWKIVYVLLLTQRNHFLLSFCIRWDNLKSLYHNQFFYNTYCIVVFLL